MTKNTLKQKIRHVLISKKKGNITSLIYGQFFMILLIVWCLYTFKVMILNTMFDYIDDALTSSVLGGALVNVEEYGKSNQLIIHDNEVYKKPNGDVKYRYWDKFEADILRSEVNYGSDIVLTYNALEPKEVIDFDARSSAGSHLNEWKSDKYLIRSISAIIGNLTYNLSSHSGNTSYDVYNNLPSADITNRIVIGKSALKQSFIGSYLVNDIELTRLDIYNVWKLNMAEKHKYQSTWLSWSGDTPSWNIPANDDEFKTWYIQNRGNPFTGSPNYSDWDSKSDKYSFSTFQAAFGGEPGWAAWYEGMLKCRAHWEVDLAVKNSGQKLICYTNTKTTYQGGHNNNRVRYNNFYATTSGNANINTLQDALRVDSLTGLNIYTGGTVTGTEQRAPISGYTVYSYKSSNSQYGYAQGTTYTGNGKQNINGVKLNNNDDTIKISGGKMNNTEIQNTSIYVEITFTVSGLFPKSWYDWATAGMSAADKAKMPFENTVTTARLIDIELNPN